MMVNVEVGKKTMEVRYSKLVVKRKRVIVRSSRLIANSSFTFLVINIRIKNTKLTTVSAIMKLMTPLLTNSSKLLLKYSPPHSGIAKKGKTLTSPSKNAIISDNITKGISKMKSHLTSFLVEIKLIFLSSVNEKISASPYYFLL